MDSHHYDPEVKSTAAIKGHPLHPAVVGFPIAFLTAAVVTDISYITTRDEFWSRASLWLLGAGIVMGLVAALLGFTDFATIRRVREHKTAWWHMGLNVAAMLLSAINLYLRVVNVERVIAPVGVILSLVVAGLLAASGWLGGELSFRHKIGVYSGHDDEAEAAEHRRAYSGD